MLDLPEGGTHETFWRVHAALSEYVDESELRLGGGTALAMRWRHRHSTDIDLWMDARDFERLTDGKRVAELTAALERACPDADSLTVGKGFVSVWLGNNELSVYPSERATSDALSNDQVTGTLIRLESSAEILTRKLVYRIWLKGDIVPRDVYDLAWCERAEPQALQIAKNGLGHREQAGISDELRRIAEGKTVWTEGERPIIDPADPALVETMALRVADLLEPGRPIVNPQDRGSRRA